MDSLWTLAAVQQPFPLNRLRYQICKEECKDVDIRTMCRKQLNVIESLFCDAISAAVFVNIAGDKIEKNEMGWACGAYGWGEGGV